MEILIIFYNNSGLIVNIEYLYEKMLNASVNNGHWMPFKREDMLERFHYNNNKRISPIFGVAENVNF